MPEPPGGLLTPLPAGTSAEIVPSGRVRGNEKRPPGQGEWRAALGHGGRLAPTLCASVLEEALLSCLRRDERGDRQNITGYGAIARKIYGEKKRPGRLGLGAGVGKVPTGRDTQNALAPALSLHLPIVASFLPSLGRT